MALGRIDRNRIDEGAVHYPYGALALLVEDC
jgi:hypothetical protein